MRLLKTIKKLWRRFLLIMLKYKNEMVQLLQRRKIMSFFKKLFSSKHTQDESKNSYDLDNWRTQSVQSKMADKSIELETKQSGSSNTVLNDLMAASGEIIELHKTQPSNSGSDDQYEYEYSIYGSSYDKIIKRVMEKIKELEEIKDFDSLCVALKISDSTIRSKIVEALGRIGDNRAVEVLKALLQERFSDVKIAAATALGEIGDERAVDALVKTMLEHSNMNVKNVFLAAESAIKKIGNQDIVELFTPALTDDNHRYQCMAAKVLGDSGDERAVDLLIAALKDGNRGVRSQAAESLGKLKDNRAVEPLIHALHDEETGGCSAAAKALGEIGDERAIEPLEAALQGWYEYDKWIVQEAINKIRFK